VRRPPGGLTRLTSSSKDMETESQRAIIADLRATGTDVTLRTTVAEIRATGTDVPSQPQ
jgi:hypothetical protein